MQQVDLGFAKFEITRQAIMAYVFGFTFLLLALGVNIALLYKSGKITSTKAIIMFVIFAIIAILYGILAAYTVNCMVVGKCIKLSWIVPSMYAFISVGYLLVFIEIMMGGKPSKELLSKNRSF